MSNTYYPFTLFKFVESNLYLSATSDTKTGIILGLSTTEEPIKALKFTSKEAIKNFKNENIIAAHLIQSGALKSIVEYF